jgi:hypothetical protein
MFAPSERAFVKMAGNLLSWMPNIAERFVATMEHSQVTRQFSTGCLTKMVRHLRDCTSRRQLIVRTREFIDGNLRINGIAADGEQTLDLVGDDQTADVIEMALSLLPSNFVFEGEDDDDCGTAVDEFDFDDGPENASDDLSNDD